MKELISHIEFLILQNDYVVIPDFGGFVLNREVASLDDNGVFLPPFIRLGFNSDLKHNDGLLAESYMKLYSVSYEVACDKINIAVKELRAALLTAKIVECGILGKLKSVENHIVFEAAPQSFIHPSVWGLSPLGLYELSKMNAETQNESKASSLWLRRSLAIASSAAAAIALFCLPISNDTSVFTKVQQSGFFINFNSGYSAKSVDEKTIVTAGRASSVIEDYIVQVNTEHDILVDKIKKGLAKPPKCYFIVVGGESNKARAERMRTSFQDQGFKDVQIVESPNMYRIYVASFMNKDEAGLYLDNFRKEYPRHQDAWLFTKRQMPQ